MKHTISVLVKNEPGVLSRIANLFSGRGYPIESLTVATTLDENYAWFTIVTEGEDTVVEQIIKQVSKLIPVIKVADFSQNSSTTFELVFIKVIAHNDLLKIVEDFGAKIIDEAENICTIQAVCKEQQLKKLVESLKAFEIQDLVRSGAVSI